LPARAGGLLKLEMNSEFLAKPTELLGRAEECVVLDRLLVEARGGASRVVVLRGEAGVGKSALIRHLSGRSDGWRIATVVGVESEMELAFSGIHQLCSPLLGYLDRLAAPQRAALETMLGLSAGPAPDRFMLSLSILTLLSEAAEDQPLLCLIDDADWLDAASAQIVGFVARRLLVERIVIVCAVRTGTGSDAFVGLPELTISGLDDSDARRLLLGNMAGPLDAAVCERIVAESHGNPLALLELPRTWNVADLAGGFGLPGGEPVAGKITQSYSHRLLKLPVDTQQLVLIAAAEPQGDPLLVRRAAEFLGLDIGVASAAVDAGLMNIHRRVEFAHPLVRSAAYGAASAAERRRVHLALAEATDADLDPDRRAWHRSRAAAGPDEDIASELERSAVRAQARGGLAAAAAFLQRAVELTADPMRRIDRALAAAQSSLQAGDFDGALALLAIAETGPVNDLQRARIGRIRGHVAFASNQGRDAPPLLLAAAKQLESLDADVARETYLDAWGAALFAGNLASSGGLVEVSRAAKESPPPTRPRGPADLLLEGLAALSADGHEAAAATLQRAAKAFATDTVDVNFRWGWLTVVPSIVLWDDRSWEVITERQVALAREAGALARLPIDLISVALQRTWRGEFAAAESAMAEARLLAEVTGREFAPFNSMHLAALRGREDELRSLVTTATAFGTARGQGNSVLWTQWATALLCNGLARYDEALPAAKKATDPSEVDVILPLWTLPELIEACVKTGNEDLGREALGRLARMTTASGTDWALGLEARCRALLSDGDAADDLYRRAIDRLGRTPLRVEFARAHLLHGEWLRREGRRLDARAALRTAHEMFAGIGMEGFAERAGGELAATGEKARKRTAETRDDLTPQEAQIARLARDGLSNPEIGVRLFISARTVEWHLRKVFAKLGISSRRQLRTVMPPDGEPVPARVT
jgi:DNA-binding CsgD family transcriptional regulator